jgi:sister chromatid cohesion protein DCC1
MGLLMIPCRFLGASFDKVECTQWVGETYLAATAPATSSAIGRSEFLRAWKDCLPETWRGEATLSRLPVT